MNENETELLDRHFAGDLNAFEQIVKRYIDPLYRFALRLTRSPRDAEDVVQETFLKAWKNMSHFKREQSFKSWIFSITHNSAMDMLRKRRTTTFSEMSGVGEDNVPFDESGAMKDDELLPDEVFERAEKNNMLDEMLHKLSPEEAEILHLYFSEDMTFREVSEMLGKPLETIKSKHRRALAKLKKLLTAPKLDN